MSCPLCARKRRKRDPTILRRSERAWKNCGASAPPALLTISQRSEHAWKNCAASALKCRRHETPRRSARGLMAVSGVFSRAIRQRVCDGISLVSQGVAAPATSPTMRRRPRGARRSSVRRADRPHCGPRANPQAPLRRGARAYAGAIRQVPAGSPRRGRAGRNRHARATEAAADLER